MRFLHDDLLSGTRRGWCVLGLLALPLLAGCGGGGGGNGNSGVTTAGTSSTGTSSTGTSSTGTSSTGTSSTGTNNGGTPTPVTITVMTATGLTASLTESNNTVPVGGSLTYTLTLTNNTAAPIPIRALSMTPTTPAATLVVKNSAGINTFEPNPPPAPPVYNESLAAGQSLTTTVGANGFTAAGVYNATATFSDDTTTAATVGPLAVMAQ